MLEFAGSLETHLTLAAHHANRMDALREFATGHGLKCLHIVLDRGQSASQPMLTRRAQGSLTGELQIAQRLARELEAMGLPITRIKIEAAPSNSDVPQTDCDMHQQLANLYFEHHVKLLLDEDSDVGSLTLIAERHQAHLSRNALRVRDDGRQERFVTQRCWSVGRTTAEERQTALTDELTQAGYTIINIEAEFVVYDSNLEVDAGWITTEE